MLKEFRDFLFRGNIVELAVAFVMGLAFAAVVNSLVNDLVMPVIAAIIGKPDFSDLTYEPDFQGVIETDDGATIFFDWDGYGRAYPPGRRQIVGSARHVSYDERYHDLNDAVCAVEGEVRARPDGSGMDLVVDVYELVWEPIAE